MPTPRTIEIEYGGQKYRGDYVIDGKMVRVGSAYGSKATQAGALAGNVETLAKMLLRELVQEWPAKKAGLPPT